MQQSVLIFGRDIETGKPMPISYNRGAFDVYLQDQNTELVNWLAHQDLNDIVLAEHASVDSKTIELQAGHNVVAGNLISLLQDTKFYQGIVTNVAVNTITLDTPIDKQFRADRDYIATRGTYNMAVDGSGTSQYFHIMPPPASLWDITQLGVFINDDASMDDTKLGGIAAITNGIVLRQKNSVYNNIGNVKRNGDLKLFGCNVTYTEKTGGGEDTMAATCEFSKDSGVTIRLDGSKSEEIEIIIQDDIDALTSLYVACIGHVVE